MRLYVIPERAKKEEGIARRFAERFESELRKLHEGLSRSRKGPTPSGRHRADPGALPRCRTALHRRRRPPRQGSGRHLTSPLPAPCSPIRVSCLRSNVHDLDPQTLSGCSPISKSELGLPHLPQNPEPLRRSYVIAYQLVQGRRRLPNTERTQLDHSASYPPRRTVSPPPSAGITLHVRKATRAEQPQLKIYTALDLDPEVSPN